MMYTDYKNVAISPYEKWCKRVFMIAKHKYEMNASDYGSIYNFRAAYEDGLGPREFVERLAKKELDLP